MDAATVLQRQKAFFATGATRPLDYRRAALRILSEALDRHEAEILQALEADLGKNPVQAFTSELMTVQLEISHALRHLKRWMKPERRSVPMLALPGSARVVREPCGAVLIIGPWNYPLQLMLAPLAGALAAGCTAILKPSEFAPHTSVVVASIIAGCFAEEHVAVFPGGKETAEELQRQSFDHVFFTGGQKAGTEVLKAAAPSLTPVTLELGGKCPALVFPGGTPPADFRRSLDAIARRIAWGKYLNAGQTCVAPDHVLVDAAWRDELIAALAKAFDSFDPADHGRIVNRRHFDRLICYLDEGTVIHGGTRDETSLRIDPSILIDIREGATMMEDEIFGPILPVIACEDVDEAIRQVSDRPPALAVYAFSEDRKLLEKITAQTISGGICFNDTVVQVAGPTLPFGGIGQSGMGRWHGHASFETFTRSRVILRRGLRIDPAFRYSPVKTSLESLRKAMKLLMRF
ncbi:MAG: aldehyde dehydrogenase family protein [Verrucomicrobiaceae bacterium]|nr:MAG: aldehyde dehydrogenase family protein [Verrucomicrobiaceae bacterium]